MSVKQKLNLIASKVLKPVNDPELIKNMLTILKEDYNVENIVDLCRKEAAKGKFSYRFKIDCVDYYPLSLDMINDWVRELATELMKPDYDFIVLHKETLELYKSSAKMEVAIKWL